MTLRPHQSSEYNHESSDLTRTTLSDHKKSLAANLGSKEKGLSQQNKDAILATFEQAEKIPSFFNIHGHEITDTRTEQVRQETKVIPLSQEEIKQEAEKVMNNHYIHAA